MTLHTLRNLMFPAVLAAGLATLAGCATAPAGVPAAPLADHHQHLFSPAIVKLINSPGFTPILASDLVGMLDTAGIRQALILSPADMYAKPGRNLPNERAQVMAENDWTAAQAALYPTRLKAMCGVNPLSAYALEELARCSTAPGFARGMKLHLGNADVQLDNPAHLARMKAFFAAANQHGMALVVHTRASISLKRPYGPEQGRILLEELFPMAPDVVIQIAHLAGSGSGPGYDDPAAHSVMEVLAQAFARNDPRLRNVWGDVASSADRNISPANAQKMAQRIRQIGVKKILYGSDAATARNLQPGEAWQAFRKLPLTDAQFATIARNLAPTMR